jgi:hypothetical protein
MEVTPRELKSMFANRTDKVVPVVDRHQVDSATSTDARNYAKTYD